MKTSKTDRSGIIAFYIAIDIVCIAVSLYLPYLLRYSNYPFIHSLPLYEKWIRLGNWALKPYTTVFLIWGVLSVLFFHHYQLYRTRRDYSYLDEAALVGKALFWASLSAAGAVFFLQIKIYSRLVFLINALCLFLSCAGWRMLKRSLVRRRVARGFNNQYVLIIGAGQVGQALAREIAQNRYLGLEVVGFLDDHPDRVPSELRILGGTDDFAEVARREFVDEILISIPSERELVSGLITQARKLGKTVRVVPDLLSLGIEGIKTGYLGQIPLLEYYSRGLHGADLFLKRSFDIIVSFLTLLFLSPVLLLIAVAIKIDSPGPAVYTSRRNGKKGKLFNFYKFRTMIPDAEGMLESLRHLNETDGPIFKIRNDPRLTRLGKFLRRYSLDELPQFWNVLKGDMSLVGPRPPTPNEVEQYADWQLKRLEIRPGLTCLWQIKGRSNLSFREWMKFDLFYIENWSFGLDIKIILRTILVVFKGQGAY